MKGTIDLFRNDLRQLVSDGKNSDKLSLTRFLSLGAWIVSSHIMIQLTMHDKMTEAYLGLYIAAFVAQHIANKAVAFKQQKEDAPCSESTLK